MNSKNLLIQPASATDAEAVIQLLHRVYEEYGFIFEPMTEVPDLLSFTRHYTAPHGSFFVIHDEEATVVGSVGVERLTDTSAELHRLYLDSDLRGQGLGRALVDAAIAWCRAEGILHLVLWSDTRFDRAHALYEHMGFRRTGERTLNDINQSREYRYEHEL